MECHNPGVRFPVLGSGILELFCFKGPQDPVPDLSGSLGMACMTFLQVFVCCVFLYPFSDFEPKKHAKMESKSTQNRWKMMSVAILKKVSANVPKILDFSFIFQDNKLIKILEKSVLVAIKMETRKQTQQIIDKSQKMSKINLKMGALTRSFFGHLASFFCARRPWEPKWLPSLPKSFQDQSKPRFPSIFC